jgi:hypothetical protein
MVIEGAHPGACSRAIAALPIEYGLDPDGNKIAYRYIYPPKGILHSGHLPFAVLDPGKVPALRALGWLDRSWCVSFDGKSGLAVIGISVKGRSTVLSLRKIIAEIHLQRGVSRVCMMPDGHPGDLRLAKLTLTRAVERGRIVKPNATPLSALTPYRESALARLA